jgi:hypothetical protein
MAKPTPAPNSPAEEAIDSANSSETSVPATSTPMRCFTGSVIAAGLATALFFLTQSIIQAFANTPIPNKSIAAANIAVAVRTLVVGVSTMATVIFGIAALGLIGLGIQLWVKQPKSEG